MRINRIIACGILYIFLSAVLPAETIELKFPERINQLSVSSSSFVDNLFIGFSSRHDEKDGSSTSDLLSYDLSTKNGIFGGFSVLREIAGPIGNKFWVVVQNPIRSYLYDFTSHTSEPFPMGDRFIEENKMRHTSVPVQALLAYQNDIYYVQMRYFVADESSFHFSKIGELNLSSGETSSFPYKGVLHAISPDKKYLLIDEDEWEDSSSVKLADRDFILYEIDSKERYFGYGIPYQSGADPGDKDYGGCFVGNENILVPIGYDKNYGYDKSHNYWLHYIGEPEKAVKLNITLDGEPVTVRLSPDFRWGLCDTDHGAYLVDATPLRDWLIANNLLFKETTAKVTDTHIRVRENPNLQAKHMGFLEQGDTVKVLDRSGPKETIDPWGEHPWYRIVRESDGLSGWCFGAFLNLAEEQGELRYTGEGMVMVYEE